MSSSRRSSSASASHARGWFVRTASANRSYSTVVMSCSWSLPASSVVQRVHVAPLASTVRHTVQFAGSAVRAVTNARLVPSVAGMVVVQDAAEVVEAHGSRDC